MYNYHNSNAEIIKQLAEITKHTTESQYANVFPSLHITKRKICSVIIKTQTLVSQNNVCK